MGIMLLFLAPDAADGCGATPLEVDLGRPDRPCHRPSSCRYRGRRWSRGVDRQVDQVGDYRYGAERIVLDRGAAFTWNFRGSVQHDVTVVGGPVGFSAPWTQSGVFRHRFTKPGTYRLFCSLHPAKMVQQISSLVLTRSLRRTGANVTGDSEQRCHALSDPRCCGASSASQPWPRAGSQRPCSSTA